MTISEKRKLLNADSMKDKMLDSGCRIREDSHVTAVALWAMAGQEDAKAPGSAL